MNLIEKFDNMLVQDVGTFNSIFKTTPILGYDSNLEVEILGLGKDGQRKIRVGDVEFYMDLTQRKSIKPEKKRVTFVRPRGVLDRAEKTKASLPKVYKMLRPAEFIIYSAIKELGEVDGIEELSRHISVSNKTIIANLPRLIQLGLVKKKYVACDSGAFNKLTVDTSVNLG